MKNNEEQVYDCICKLVPTIDPNKVINGRRKEKTNKGKD